MQAVCEKICDFKHDNSNWVKELNLKKVVLANTETIQSKLHTFFKISGDVNNRLSDI